MMKILKYIAPKAFLDGLDSCNALGLRLASERTSSSFLDVGCGDGSLTMEFAKAAGAKNVYGIEYVDSVRKEAEAKGIQCIKQDLNAAWELESDKFDFILSSQNIEHMHNSRLYLEECYRCLAPGGQLIVLTENLASWVNVGSLFFGWQPFSTTNMNGWSIGNPFIWHADEPKDEEFIAEWQATGISGATGHVRVLAYSGLEGLLQKVGFHDLRLFTTGYLPLWGALSKLLCTIDRRHGHFLIATGFKRR